MRFASAGVVGMYASGGTVDTRFVNDGGYTARSSGGYYSFTLDEMKSAFKEAVGELKIYTSIEEIRQADANYTIMDNIAKV